MVFQLGGESRAAFGSQKFGRGLKVTLSKRLQQFDGGIAIAARGNVPHGDKLVRNFCHGADHNYGRPL